MTDQANRRHDLDDSDSSGGSGDEQVPGSAEADAGSNEPDAVAANRAAETGKPTPHATHLLPDLDR